MGCTPLSRVCLRSRDEGEGWGQAVWSPGVFLLSFLSPVITREGEPMRFFAAVLAVVVSTAPALAGTQPSAHPGTGHRPAVTAKGHGRPASPKAAARRAPQGGVGAHHAGRPASTPRPGAPKAAGGHPATPAAKPGLTSKANKPAPKASLKPQAKAGLNTQAKAGQGGPRPAALPQVSQAAKPASAAGHPAGTPSQPNPTGGRYVDPNIVSRTDDSQGDHWTEEREEVPTPQAVGK